LIFIHVYLITVETIKIINTVKIRKIAEVGKFFRKLARGNCGDFDLAKTYN